MVVVAAVAVDSFGREGAVCPEVSEGLHLKEAVVVAVLSEDREEHRQEREQEVLGVAGLLQEEMVSIQLEVAAEANGPQVVPVPVENVS